MKKQFIVLFSLLTIAISASAQKEYKLAKASGHLTLNIPGAIIEGYSGNEIIFSTSSSEKEEVDERAKGLRAISASGYIDNTGLGLDVSDKGDEVIVNSVGRERDRAAILTIKVPQNIKITFVNKSSTYQSEVILKNLKNELDISTSYNKIKLENNSGPMNIKTLYGSIDAIFSGEIKGPVSIVSVYGYVDVSLPVTTKANVELATSYGKLYAAEGFKMAIDPSAKEKNSGRDNSGQYFDYSTTVSNAVSGALATTINSNFNRNSDSIKGKINGGGADMILKSSYKNVYLRDK
jgi:hypothetical protein